VEVDLTGAPAPSLARRQPTRRLSLIVHVSRPIGLGSGRATLLQHVPAAPALCAVRTPGAAGGFSLQRAWRQLLRELYVAGTHRCVVRAQARPAPRAPARPPAPSASCRRGCAGRRGRARARPARGPAAARARPSRPARRREPTPRMCRHLAHRLHCTRRVCTLSCMPGCQHLYLCLLCMDSDGCGHPRGRAARERHGCTGRRCSIRVKDIVLTLCWLNSKGEASAPACGGRPHTCVRTRRRCASARRSWRRAAPAGRPTASRSPTRSGRAWRAASRALPPARRARPRRARLRLSSPSRARRSARRRRPRQSLPWCGPLFTALFQAPSAAWTRLAGDAVQSSACARCYGRVRHF